MKVLLIQDVKTLGKAGEIKEVKAGYGQNFLVAKGFAKPATPEVLEQHAKDQKIAAENLAKEIAELKELAKKLDKCPIVITKKTGDNGSLFGSITKEEIAQSLLEQHNIEIDKKHITEKLAIKTIGKHDVDFKLGHGLHAVLHLDVVGE